MAENETMELAVPLNVARLDKVAVTVPVVSPVVLGELDTLKAVVAVGE